MPSIYKNKEELHNILSALWEKIFNTPEITDKLSELSLTVKFRFTDIKTCLYIVVGDGEKKCFWDPEKEIKADVEMILASDTGHRFWLEDLNIPLALAGQKIIAKGSIQKALRLLPALKPAFKLYPEILMDKGRDDLLKSTPTGKGHKKRFLFFKKKRTKSINNEEIPKFHLYHDEKPQTVPKAKDIEKEITRIDLYKKMYTIRAFENHLSTGFKNGEIPSEAIHLSIGQEAIAAGVCLNLRNSDYINTTHRGHGHIIAKGADLSKMMAELYGKASGQCEGKGGSMHVTDGSLGVLGANGIVGAGYLLAMGAAQTIQYKKRDDISVVFAGDGSVNQGMFHEALNMIKVFDLPVLIIVENNLYGEFTPIEKHSAETDISKRMQAYNIESYQIDGNDADLVFEKTAEIISKMRQDGKPRGIEFKTYRWHGHMEGEPELYRSAEEKESYILQDPIKKLKSAIIEANEVDDSEFSNIESNILTEISAAVDYAKASELPSQDALFSRIYYPDDAKLFNSIIPPCETGIELSYSQAVNQAIAEEMTRDENVFLWGEDVALGGYFSVSEGLVEQFGRDRIIDTPISENAIIGGAVGAAMTGLRPVCEILFGDFLTCCMDPIMNQAAKLRYMTGGQVSMPLTVRTPVGSGIGMAAQHSQSMERFFYGIPGLIVIAPSDPYTAKGLLKSAIRSNNPVIFFEHKLLYAVTGVVPENDYTLPIGKARIVKEGSDVTIVSHLLGVSVAVDAAGLLEADGISAEVIDLATLYPIDTATILESVSKTGMLVTLEEGTMTGGIGAEVIARVTSAGFNLLTKAPVRIAAPDCPIPYAKNLENMLMLNPDDIASKIKKCF